MTLATFGHNISRRCCNFDQNVSWVEKQSAFMHNAFGVECQVLCVVIYVFFSFYGFNETTYINVAKCKCNVRCLLLSESTKCSNKKEVHSLQ
mgnify:CR=1 FL=1